MKKVKVVKTEFVFWRENLLTKAYTMSIEDIKNAYRKYLEGKELSWIEYYGDQTVFAFVSDKMEVGGLNSVAEQSDIKFLVESLMEVRHEFYK